MDGQVSRPTNVDLRNKQDVSYANIASITWLIWDVLIHLEFEADCIWTRPRSWVSWLYAFVRYIPILHSAAVFPLTINRRLRFSSVGCRVWAIYELTYMELLTLTVEGILMMRVYILYNHNKLVLAVILACFAAEVAAMLVFLGVVIPQQVFTSDCLVAHSPRIYIAYWVVSLAFETFLFILTLIQFSGVALREFRRKSLIYVFIRDGTWAYALLFVALLLNTLMYQLNDTPLSGMGYCWLLSVMSFAGSHILLNLRRIGSNNSADIMSFHLEEVETSSVQMEQEVVLIDNNDIGPAVTQHSHPTQGGTSTSDSFAPQEIRCTAATEVGVATAGYCTAHSYSPRLRQTPSLSSLSRRSRCLDS